MALRLNYGAIMALKTVDEEGKEQDEVFDQCYLCRKWWWQRAMMHVFVPDQDGCVRKYVCVPCFRDVNERSCPMSG